MSLSRTGPSFLVISSLSLVLFNDITSLIYIVWSVMGVFGGCGMQQHCAMLRKILKRKLENIPRNPGKLTHFHTIFWWRLRSILVRIISRRLAFILKIIFSEVFNTSAEIILKIKATHVKIPHESVSIHAECNDSLKRVVSHTFMLYFDAGCFYFV